MLTKPIKRAIFAHADSTYPKECCGLIVKENSKKYYLPCANLADDNDSFSLDPRDIVRADGEIVAIVHSHPDGTTAPSVLDKAQMSLHALPWVIVCVGELGRAIDTFLPDDYTAPLLGREYVHGVQDCYSLIKDYYKRELNISLGDYERADGWWEHKDSASLYVDNVKKEGFFVVDSPQKHDVILCRVGDTAHINHALIYIDDGKLLSERTPQTAVKGLVLHHPYGRLSVRELYGQDWQDKTAMIVRHTKG